ncbi:MAG: SEL1-like repeat protein [Lachnospiraceae bacterium]|nr:SEL1-like repeat protein [Lachnospiraceae bacterium]
MADWWKDQNMVQQVYEEAENGNTAAQCEIARRLMNDRRMDEAVSWYKRAAAAGEADAMFNLGLLYSQGWEGEEPAPEQAFFWFKSAAQAGDSEGMYMTGRCCLKGIGTETDSAEGAQWLKKALAAGYAAAQDLLYTIPGMKEERQAKLDEIRQTAGNAERFLAEEDYEMAVPLLQQALEESSKKLGETDAFTISLMNNLAVALAALEQYENSIPLKERVLELRGKCLPVTHPDYLTAVTNLTSDYARIGRYQSALNLSKQAYTAARETLPVTHDVTLLTLNRLAADYMNLCRHDLALEQLQQVIGMIEEICGGDEEIPQDSRKQWYRSRRLMQVCQEALNNYQAYFGMEESRRNYAYISAELCEMLDGLPDDYRQKIDPQEYAHFREQADLVGCYHPHMNSGQSVETDPYTNALQMLVSLKYLMPAVAECREELDGIRCRAVATWVQNELCAVITVYPVRSSVDNMKHPQPADFLKSLNACEEPGEKVTSLDAVDLQMKRMENGEIQISFAYGTDDVYRMIRMHYQEETNQLEGESCFMEIGKNHTEA